MVVKKRKASLPPLKKIVLNDDPNNEVVDKKRAPTTPVRTVSLQSPGPIMNMLADDSSNSPSGDENGDLEHSSAFVEDSADQTVNQIFSYETTSPLYFKSFQSGLELEISADGNITEGGDEKYEEYEDTIEHRDNIITDNKEQSSFEKIYDNDERGIIVNGEEIVETSEEKDVREKHTVCVNVSEDGTKTEKTTTEEVKTVVMRTRTKNIDLTIRTSQIEDLDENEILKELTANGEIIHSVSHEETDRKAQFEDEADFTEGSAKRKSEILLKVDELGDTINEMLENFSANTTAVCNGPATDVVLSSPRKYSSNSSNSPIVGQKLSIAGWADFAKGKGLGM